MNLDKVRKSFKAQLKEAASNLDKEPYEVSMAEFLASCKEANYSHIKHAGGFTNLQKLYYPKPLIEEAGNKIIKGHLTKLNKEYGSSGYLLRELEASLLNVISKEPIKYHKAPRKVKSKGVSKRTVVAHLSDLHYGLIIDNKEVDNNSFNWLVASRRTAQVFQQIVEYKTQHRQNSDLVILLNGDILHGLLHDVVAIDPLSTQFVGAMHILTQGISYAATQYSKVEVVCTSGNHGRNPLRHPGRATSQKWDSFETMLYKAIELATSKVHKNVKFTIPKTIFCDVQLHGHRLFVSHGDTGFKLGNPGKSINTKGIVEQINTINAAIKTGKQYNAFFFGHLHTAMHMEVDSGVHLMMNGCLGGVDAYANSIGIYDNPAVQTIFECTPQHVVGDVRFIELKGSENDTALDAIISPFEGI